jgi:antitoxin ParD1/3/4
LKSGARHRHNEGGSVPLSVTAMNVSLTPELEQLVHEKVKSGRYLSASEVVREGLRLLEERDRLYKARLTDLQKEITIGVEEAERGELSRLA